MTDQTNQANKYDTTNNSGSDGWIHTDSSIPVMTPRRFRQDCRAEGRNALLGHLGIAVLSILAYFAILMALQQITGSLLPTGSGIDLSLIHI